MALTLKHYQTQALQALAQFFSTAKAMGAKAAFEKAVDYEADYVDRLEGVPAVCVRVPTGGGKTLLAAHSIAVAADNYVCSSAPIVLWLVPSDMIRTQTLKALADVRHSYRQAVMQRYGERIKVSDLENLQTINPHDVGKSCLMIVTTIQSFNISKTEKRNVYAFFEELSPHFDSLTPQQTQGMERVTEETIKAQPYLTEKDLGRVIHSLANWFHLHRPIIVLDEAHKSRTKLSFETFRRLNPACFIELTATPRDNNVLYSVSAAELKTEEMIKLPVVLTEHPDGWQACLRDALLQRKQLELDAQQDPTYIRPILLVQAQPKGQEATVDVVKTHLIANEAIPEAQIAISTGSTKELTDINLFAPDCVIRVIITVEALKEGWDCSFAYVLASLQNMKSAIDVEQLLGRVLRMPFAKRRNIESLNKAYAHVMSDSTAQAASLLKDRMVENMGFNKWEAQAAVVQRELSVDSTQPIWQPPIVPALVVALPHLPDTSTFSDEVLQAIEVRPTQQGKAATLIIAKGTSEDTFKQIEQFVVHTTPAKKQAQVQAAFNDARAERQASKAGENWNATFVPVPKLCLFVDDEWVVLDKEELENLAELDLLKHPVSLAHFTLRETAHSFEIDMSVAKEQVTYKFSNTEQLAFDAMQTDMTVNGFVSVLDRQVRHVGLTQRQLQAYLLKLIDHLIHVRGFSLTALVRAQFQLVQAIKQEMERLFSLAREETFQSDFFHLMTVPPQPEPWQTCQFQAGVYPVRVPYRGSYEFSKHFYPQIEDLREKKKDGKDAEEFACAREIDMLPKVKYWVRNIDKQPQTSFWLPTATDYFYPDFVCELVDGSIAVIEYKGEVYVTNDDSKEKNLVGEQWAKNSQGKRRFLMARKKAEDGRSLKQQIDELLA